MYKITPDALKGKRILVAEDDRSSFLYIETLLKKAGAYIEWAQNGRIAVETIQQKPDFDVVLMDLTMPVMNGYDAIEYIKFIKPTLPIVVQSSNANDYKNEHLIMTDNMEFIEKPFTPYDLISAIKNVMSIIVKV
jgi:CheY-like chemotaxis protein